MKLGAVVWVHSNSLKLAFYAINSDRVVGLLIVLNPIIREIDALLKGRVAVGALHYPASLRLIFFGTYSAAIKLLNQFRIFPTKGPMKCVPRRERRRQRRCRVSQTLSQHPRKIPSCRTCRCIIDLLNHVEMRWWMKLTWSSALGVLSLLVLRYINKFVGLLVTMVAGPLKNLVSDNYINSEWL